FFSSRRRHTRSKRDWSSDVCSSDLDSLKERGGFWLKVGDKGVHVGTEDGFDRTTTKSHLAYLVNDISYWRRVIGQNNIQIMEGVPIPGYDRFEFRDPFGNRVEMIQKL